MPNRLNILIIEDDLFQRTFLKKMLAAMVDADFRTATNGIEAQQVLETEFDPDYIFCDLNMPEMDGIEFLRCLSERHFTGSVILVSAADSGIIDSVSQMAQSYGIGNVQVMRKPIPRQQLAAVLKQPHTRPTHRTPGSLPQLSDNEILRAITNDEFVPFFQPHICAKTRRVINAEALVRWNHPTSGTLSPGLFLDQITRLNLMHLLTKSMLKQAIEACARWYSQGVNTGISVNVSPSDLVDMEFADTVLRLLKDNDLPSQKLTLEVTETEVSPHLAKMLETTTRLRLKGVQISLDDFGTGYSSMLQLITGPFTELKIDQCFIRNMQHNDKQMLVVKTSLELAKGMGLTTVGEGVETEQEAQILADLGCDIFQGFLFSPALPEAKFLEWTDNHNKTAKHPTGLKLVCNTNYNCMSVVQNP